MVSVNTTDKHLRIARAMERRGLTQTDLAAKVGVSKSAVSHWLAGRGISLEKLKAVADALDVNWWYLWSGDATQKYPPEGFHILTDEELTDENGQLQSSFDSTDRQILASVNTSDDPISEAQFIDIYNRLLPTQRAELVSKARQMDSENRLTLATLLRTYKPPDKAA